MVAKAEDRSSKCRSNPGLTHHRLGATMQRHCRTRTPGALYSVLKVPRSRPEHRCMLTLFCVATKKKGLAGWKAQLVTRPLFLRKGFCDARLDSWCTRTDCRVQGQKEGGQV